MNIARHIASAIVKSATRFWNADHLVILIAVVVYTAVHIVMCYYREVYLKFIKKHVGRKTHAIQRLVIMA